ncbi:DUF2889 domain-containing protein [Pseudomonas sp. MYb185]|uniref:DUF2889 domain-containing protein n=1 Tax=Pseudomonas sp. MYb185 TaxID=1848729 RepID=UPI000CFD5AE9|nr:DUF2889 domain-containing protein [Pseudomonas sp. MYb185]PRB84463.1 hypothetical protein CQ007_01400 [Pseudomonas sp. MYb185]
MQVLQSPHVFYRRVLFEVSATECQVAMEDEHHYFVLNLRHDGARITAVDSTSRRTPWTLCPQAASRLQEFVGQPLRQRIAVNLPDIDGKQQCTHQYDLLMVALSQALRPGRREYVAKVIGAMHEHRHAELWLNDEKLLDWRLRGTVIDSQDQFDQRDLRNILPWADEHLDDQSLEALYVQRRAVMVAASKGIDLDRIPNAGVAMRARAGACFVFQPERAESAVRVLGNTREDVRGPEDLLVGWGEHLAEV